MGEQEAQPPTSPRKLLQKGYDRNVFLLKVWDTLYRNRRKADYKKENVRHVDLEFPMNTYNLFLIYQKKCGETQYIMSFLYAIATFRAVFLCLAYKSCCRIDIA